MLHSMHPYLLFVRKLIYMKEYKCMQCIWLLGKDIGFPNFGTQWPF